MFVKKVLVLFGFGAVLLAPSVAGAQEVPVPDVVPSTLPEAAPVASVSLSAATETPVVDRVMAVTATVEAGGAGLAEDVRLKIAVPDGVVVSDVNAPEWAACASDASGDVGCSVASMNAGDSTAVRVVGVADPDLVGGQSLVAGVSASVATGGAVAPASVAMVVSRPAPVVTSTTVRSAAVAGDVAVGSGVAPALDEVPSAVPVTARERTVEVAPSGYAVGSVPSDVLAASGSTSWQIVLGGVLVTLAGLVVLVAGYRLRVRSGRHGAGFGNTGAF